MVQIGYAAFQSSDNLIVECDQKSFFSIQRLCVVCTCIVITANPTPGGNCCLIASSITVTGNDGSGFIEVLVGRSSSPEDYQVSSEGGGHDITS